MGLARLPGPLLLLTDRQQARMPLVEIVEAALQGGCRWVSVREKDLPAHERHMLVRKLLPPVRQFGGTLLVHGDELAAQMADGVHLPAQSNVAEVRKRLGNQALIGLSCHTLEDVKHAHGADYVTLGPIAPTPSKPGYLPTFGFDTLEKASQLGLPVLALGGVDETNVRELQRAGAAGFALMGTVMRSQTPRALVQQMLQIWHGA